MQIVRIPYLVLVFGITLCLFSCVSQKKVSSSKKELGTINAQLGQSGNSLKDIDAQRTNKERQNEIDDTTNNRIKKFIDKTQVEIDTLINKNTILIGETVVNKADLEKLQKSLAISASISK